MIDAWQDSEYSSGSKYGKGLNMPGLHKVWTKRSIVDVWQGSDYSARS